ncbi:MAG: hypothetical protein HZC29_03305 [Thaumarchaeota archaeon]|nr:hypothetical protein [Nitrososphaerota archaeon]
MMVAPAFAEPLSDKTGLKTNFSVQVGSSSYPIESTANFDVRNISYQDNKLVFAINSSLENNVGEIQIPNDITQGELKFSLDGEDIAPKVLHNEKISFITLEFAGNGTHTLEVTSDYIPEPTKEQVMVPIKPDNTNDFVIILSVVGIVIAGGAATTGAVYLKRKKA